MKKIGCFISTGFNMLTLARLSAAVDLANSLFPKIKPYQLNLLSAEGGALYSACTLPVNTQRATAELFSSLNSLLIMEKGPAGQSSFHFDNLSLPSTSTSHNVNALGKQKHAFQTLLAGFEPVNAQAGAGACYHLATFATLLPKVSFDKESALLLADKLWTAGGVWAGIDLVLTLVEEESGVAAAMQLINTLEGVFNKYENNSQLAVLQNFSSDGNSDRINASLRFIRDNLRNKVTITHLAERANLSPRQFSRLFKEETGTSPAKAVAQIRAEVARQHVLQDRLSIDKIASLCGFSGTKSLRRAFLKFYGETPWHLRQK